MTEEDDNKKNVKLKNTRDITPPDMDGYVFEFKADTASGRKLITSSSSGSFHAINEDSGLSPGDLAWRSVAGTIQKNPYLLSPSGTLDFTISTFGVSLADPLGGSATEYMPPPAAETSPPGLPTLIEADEISLAHVTVCKLRSQINTCVSARFNEKLFRPPDELHLIDAFLKPEDYDRFTSRMNDLHEINVALSSLLKEEPIKGTFRKLESWLIAKCGVSDADARTVYSTFEAIRAIRHENTHMNEDNAWAYRFLGLEKPIESDFDMAYDHVIGRLIETLKIIRGAVCS